MTEPRKPSPVTVFKPDGEIQIRVARSFKKKLERKPVRLSRETRRKISGGEHPRLTFPFGKPCPVEPGDGIWITKLLWVEITKVDRDGLEERWVADYVEHNERPRLLRARTHAADFDAIKERLDGKIDKARDIEASEESGYTTSTGSAMKGEPEAVPREYQEQLSEGRRRDHLAAWEEQRAAIEEAVAKLRENPEIDNVELGIFERRLKRIEKQIRRGQAKEVA